MQKNPYQFRLVRMVITDQIIAENIPPTTKPAKNEWKSQ